jgi:hypothetical protein
MILEPVQGHARADFARLVPVSRVWTQDGDVMGAAGQALGHFSDIAIRATRQIGMVAQG